MPKSQQIKEIEEKKKWLNRMKNKKRTFFWVNKNGIYYSASYVSQFIYLFIYLCCYLFDNK